jgi:hypothetical protein
MKGESRNQLQSFGMNSILSSINPKIEEIDETVKSITFKEPVINKTV